MAFQSYLLCFSIDKQVSKRALLPVLWRSWSVTGAKIVIEWHTDDREG
jgi:hypothetical protein